MTGFDVLSGVQGRALDALATYGVLTVDLMRMAGVGRDPKNLRESLEGLSARGLIGRTKAPPFEPGFGRFPHLFWLQPKGAKVLGELRDAPVSVSTGKVTITNQLPHLLGIVAAHVACRQWAAESGAVVDFFRADFERGGDFQKGTALPYRKGEATYSPDALARLTLPGDPRPAPLVVEVYRGGRKGRLDHFGRKLPELREVAETAAVEHWLGGGVRAARFLVIFTDRDMRDAALRTWPDREAAIWQRFFVKSLDEVGAFGLNWAQPSGALVSLFS